MDDHLVSWFSSIIASAGRAAGEWAGRLDDLTSAWAGRVSGLRTDAAARRLLPILAEIPVLSVEVAATRLGVSLPAARHGLNVLVEVGILDELGTVSAGRGRPWRWWSAPELLELVTG